MAKLPITPEMSRWLAHLQMAYAWTKEPGVVDAINAGFAAGSLEKMPDREKYDFIIARYEREKAAAEAQGRKKKEHRWGK